MGRLIDAIQLKISIAYSNILDDGKTLDQIIDEQPTIEPEPPKTCNDCPNFNKTMKLIPLPERKKGRWIEHNPHKWGLGVVFECSECGEKTDCEPSNYCPNCGADMRENKDE